MPLDQVDILEDVVKFPYLFYWKTRTVYVMFCSLTDSASLSIRFWRLGVHFKRTGFYDIHGGGEIVSPEVIHYRSLLPGDNKCEVHSSIPE